MGKAPIPFVNQQASGFEALGGASPVAVNVCVDPTGAVFRRPGIAPLMGANGGKVLGLHVTLNDKVLAVYDSPGERTIWDVSDVASPFRLATSGGVATGLPGTARPQFAETEMIVAIAGGADMQKVVLGPPETTDRLGGIPPFATHVIASQSRLLANDLRPTSSRTIVRFSGIAQGTITYAGLEQWTLGIGNAGFFTAEANPDPILALANNSNEVLAFGNRTLQVFGSDPASVFAPVAARELGMEAPYSVIAEDQMFNWVADKRRIIKSDGRDYNVLSDPIKGTLDAMSRVDDVYGYRLLMGYLDVLWWTFPSDGRTFAWQKGGGWSEWLSWFQNWQVWPVTAYAYRPSTGQHLVGLDNGKIGTLSLDVADDGTNLPIRAFIQTGFLDRETDALKWCQVVRFSLRRGTTQSATGPQAFFWWADRPGETMAHVPISLGASGDDEIVVEFRGLGTYRRRQWFFEFAGSERLTLVSATEEFTVLEV